MVLGDDIVIGDPKVAAQYLVKMNLLGMDIGLHKSLISRSNDPVMEFAKKYYIGKEDASMVSIRDVLVTTLSTAVGAEFMKKHRFGLNAYLALRGLGYKVRGSITGRL